MGRLVRDPEVRYSQGATPIAVVRFTLAVARRFKKDGEPEADFINCVAFGKNGEFVERFFKKGQMVALVGHIQVRSWDDKSGKKQWTTEVIVEENYFAESKAAAERNVGTQASTDGFYPIDESVEDDDLPF